MWVLWATLGLVTGTVLGASGGRRVCARQTLLLPMVYTETFIQPVYQPYITLCEGHRSCSTYRTLYRVSDREVRRDVYQTVYRCCPGWSKRQEHTANCDIAICTKPCQNGGSCSHPDTCTCLPGWAGKTCSKDVDECRAQVPLCQQRCVNTPGSYRCQCLPGYVLRANQKSCHRSTTPSPRPITTHLPLPPVTVQSGSDGIGNEVEEMRSRLESLEQKMEWTLKTFEHLMLATSDRPILGDPMSLENTRSLISQFQQLDRIDSLSDQIAFLEERLDTCSCPDQS